MKDLFFCLRPWTTPFALNFWKLHVFSSFLVHRHPQNFVSSPAVFRRKCLWILLILMEMIKLLRFFFSPSRSCDIFVLWASWSERFVIENFFWTGNHGKVNRFHCRGSETSSDCSKLSKPLSRLSSSFWCVVNFLWSGKHALAIFMITFKMRFKTTFWFLLICLLWLDKS